MSTATRCAVSRAAPMGWSPLTARRSPSPSVPGSSRSIPAAAASTSSPKQGPAGGFPTRGTSLPSRARRSSASTSGYASTVLVQRLLRRQAVQLGAWSTAPPRDGSDGMGKRACPRGFEQRLGAKAGSRSAPGLRLPDVRGPPVHRRPSRRGSSMRRGMALHDSDLLGGRWSSEGRLHGKSVVARLESLRGRQGRVVRSSSS